MAVLDTFNIMLVGRLLKARSGAELAKYDLCYGLGGMVAPYIAILVHKHSWDVLATVDLILAAVVIRRRACIGSFAAWRHMRRTQGTVPHNYSPCMHNQKPYKTSAVLRWDSL